MRILVENGTTELTNMGDVAMLQAAVTRLRQFWPAAQIDVVTSAPGLLEYYCPGTRAVTPSWPERQSLKWLPPSTSRRLLQAYERLAWLPDRRGGDERLVQSLLQADLVVACGGGYINAAFPGIGSRVLAVLRLGSALGRPTALFGQGIGPLDRSHAPVRPAARLLMTVERMRLSYLVRAALPNVGVIALREGRMGPQILRAAGVAPGRFTVTGDDAIELAYSARPECLGNRLGFNLRLAPYAETDQREARHLRAALPLVQRRCKAEFLPLPVSLGTESDVAAIRLMLDTCDVSQPTGSGPLTPENLIHLVGRCRVVITASYHAAVFALAQGVSVVALLHSQYYLDKFMGLADLFGTGCTLLSLADPDLPTLLPDVVAAAWDRAPEVRPLLLDAAQYQIGLGRGAYERVWQLVQAAQTSRCSHLH